MSENVPMILTFAILGLTIALFIFSRLRADLVALLSLLALFATGILTSKQALSGFADSTVIMVAALFVVGEGLSRTGITAWLGQFFMRQAGDSDLRLMVVVMLGTAVLSAFLSNTGTVAMLLPAVVAASWRIGGLPSRFLLPMAIAANLGGLMTLIGSPPNIVVSDTLVAAGFASFGFFEFAIIGIPLTLAAAAFVLLFGRKLLPSHQTSDRPVDLDQSMGRLSESYRLTGKLFRVRVRNASSLVGKTLADAALGRDFGVTVLDVFQEADPDEQPASRRDRRRHGLQERLDWLQADEGRLPSADTVIRAQDMLLVKGDPNAVTDLTERFNVGVQPVDPSHERLSDLLLSQEVGVAEVILTPRSRYSGQTVAESQIGDTYQVQVITVRRGDSLLPRKSTQLQFGDSLLVRGKWENIERIGKETDNFVVVGEPQAMARQVIDLTPRSLIAVLTLLGMVALMLFNVMPTVMAVLLAAAVMVITGCVTPDGAYRAINWQTVILIAAMLPMSIALEITGGAELIANGLISTLGTVGPLAMLAGAFLLTTGFSQVMSNTATTVLVAPIVLQAALGLGIAPQPMLMMVAVGAGAAFLTPIASPTNTLVLAPGGYSWGDYARIGLPLLLLVLFISLLIVPIAWPL
ncbi:MAG: SLC13 family permease [Anaerolineae bacterium]|nr:SLC13 family permease [Anaerolineae bacterium]MCB9130179.1 SLC13 family permease [Anaerolineales bacterium]